MAATSLSDGLQVWLTSNCVRHSTFQAGQRDSCCVSNSALETFQNALSTSSCRQIRKRICTLTAGEMEEISRCHIEPTKLEMWCWRTRQVSIHRAQPKHHKTAAKCLASPYDNGFHA